MYNLVLFVAVAALLSSTCNSANVNRHMKLISDIDNSIDTNAVVHTKESSPRRFVSLTRRPEASYSLAPGDALELTCDAVGAPAPSIHWFKNDAPVYEYDMESNELIDGNPTSVARVSSTLLVSPRHAADRHGDADEYTCVVAAAGHTARADTLVYTTGGSTELTERAKLYPLEPRIVVSFKVYVDEIGTNIVLPCRAKGHPRPHITWWDNRSNIVKDPRMKVLRSGELVISSLRWEDMGEWTCRATNAFGTQLAKTFVYPAKAG